MLLEGQGTNRSTSQAGRRAVMQVGRLTASRKRTKNRENVCVCVCVCERERERGRENRETDTHGGWGEEGKEREKEDYLLFVLSDLSVSSHKSQLNMEIVGLNSHVLK